MEERQRLRLPSPAPAAGGGWYHRTQFKKKEKTRRNFSADISMTLFVCLKANAAQRCGARSKRTGKP